MADQRARYLRANTTKAERRLWRGLRVLKVKGLHFRRQAPMGRYCVDFVCHGAKLVIEFDGSQHAEPAAKVRDLTRTKFLNSRGYKVLRFWNIEVMREYQSVLDTVLAAATIPPPEICSR